jgi:autophagy-related protein 13
MSRPSPPFAPSSLSDRKSAEGDGEQRESPRLGQRKRYSSSFSHRYNNSGGAGSEGSAGSGGERERRDSERVGVSVLLAFYLFVFCFLRTYAYLRT